MLGFDDLSAPASAIARVIEPGLFGPFAVPLHSAIPRLTPGISVEPASVRLSIVKRTEGDDRLIVRLIGPDTGETDAVVELPWPVKRVWLSDLDERWGEELEMNESNRIRYRIRTGEVVTFAIEVGV